MKPGKQLYQWDVNQFLIELQPTAEFVDYPMGNEVIRIKSDGTRCRIPDEVLQTYGGKTCYERYTDGTYRAYSFTVLYAPKPPDYVYTPEERTTFEALTARVDASIEEIKRRADSGEFTPVKGVDYFTDAEKNEMMESVSSGAVGEFRKVVDTATTEYNDNHNLKLEKYNANASEKLTTYDTNAEQHTTDYNRNAAEKLEAYNSNHTAKVAEYNQNAETKTAEFDSNAAALQTEVDRLRGECDKLAAENRKQENRISALLKLNKGQTYDILPEEGETASRTAPSGAKYVSVDNVGGKSIVWNQLYDRTKPTESRNNGITFSHQEDGSFVATGKNTGGTMSYVYTNVNVTAGHIYFSKSIKPGDVGKSYLAGPTIGNSAYDRGNGAIATASQTGIAKFVIQMFQNGAEAKNEVAHPRLFDLTLMFGAGNEPTAEQFEAMFPADSYPYNPGEIISAKTATITAGTEAITTGFPELRSARAAHDYIDMDGGTIQRNIGAVDLGTLDWIYNSEYRFMIARVDGRRAGAKNLIISRYNLSPNEVWQQDTDGVYGGNQQNNMIYIKDLNYSDPATFKVAIRGVMLHYELATPTTEPVTIPEALQEWLPVEPGGTVTFKNADESKQLAVPNAVSWVRKLNEVE